MASSSALQGTSQGGGRGAAWCCDICGVVVVGALKGRVGLRVPAECGLKYMVGICPFFSA